MEVFLTSSFKTVIVSQIPLLLIAIESNLYADSFEEQWPMFETSSGKKYTKKVKYFNTYTQTWMHHLSHDNYCSKLLWSKCS